MLRMMGFRLRNWMKKCYGLVSFFILLNGESVNYLKISRGLRQRDPLSLFLFLIVVEALGAMLAKGFQSALLEGILIGKEGVVVSYLQLADDTLILFRGSADQMRILRCVIKCFVLVSGMEINLSKSKMFGVG